MLTIDRALEVNNPAAVLLNEDGVFEVVSPLGSVFEVTCQRGSKMSFREISESKQKRCCNRMIWRIRRLRRIDE